MNETGKTLEWMTGKRVLIVDDEAPFRIYLRKLFERHGCLVETSASGLLSLEITSVQAPDVLVIDWMLKDAMDGLQVAAELRKRNPDLSTVLITGYPAPQMEERMRKEPRTTFLSKPFEAIDVLNAVRSVLE
jgi:two-component system response regulator RegA